MRGDTLGQCILDQTESVGAGNRAPETWRVGCRHAIALGFSHSEMNNLRLVILLHAPEASLIARPPPPRSQPGHRRSVYPSDSDYKTGL